MKCIRITISGDIYGSGMRFSVMHFAKDVGVNGFVQYNSCGEIIIEAEGREEQLSEFVSLCREWSASFVVSGVEVSECETKWYSSFDIRHGLHGVGTLEKEPVRASVIKSFFNRVRRVFSSDNHSVSKEIQ